jgi:hypothetical protein
LRKQVICFQNNAGQAQDNCCRHRSPRMETVGKTKRDLLSSHSALQQENSTRPLGLGAVVCGPWLRPLGHPCFSMQGSKAVLSEYFLPVEFGDPDAWFVFFFFFGMCVCVCVCMCVCVSSFLSLAGHRAVFCWCDSLRISVGLPLISPGFAPLPKRLPHRSFLGDPISMLWLLLRW